MATENISTILGAGLAFTAGKIVSTVPAGAQGIPGTAGTPVTTGTTGATGPAGSGTPYSGTGTAGYLQVDATGKPTGVGTPATGATFSGRAFPGPVINTHSPIQSRIFQWFVPDNFTLTQAVVSIPQVSGATNGITISFQRNAVDIPGMNNCVLTGTAATNGFTPTAGNLVLTSADALEFTILSVQGTFPAIGTLTVQFFGIYT